MKTYKITGYTRYNFTTDGKCINAATGDPISEVKETYGIYYRPINDQGKRVVLYKKDVITLCKAQAKAAKEAKSKVILPDGFMHVYTIKSKKLKATMYKNDKSFVVEKGSQANKNIVASLEKRYQILRGKMIAENTLSDKGDYYEFTKDQSFESASAAANIVLGRQSSGKIVWGL